MAGTDLSDRVAELAAATLDLYVTSGVARQRIGWVGDPFGELAKASGQSAEAVQAQLADPSLATPGQAVALVRALRMRAARPGFGDAA